MLILTPEGKIVEGIEISEEEQYTMKQIIQGLNDIPFVSYMTETNRTKIVTWLIENYKIILREVVVPEQPTIENPKPVISPTLDDDLVF